MTPDPRLTPARPDLAAKHLEGKVTAARFVAGEPREIVEPMTPLRRTPSPDSPLDTEALKGERVTVYETTEEGWAWGQLDGDGYVGYLSENALAPARSGRDTQGCGTRGRWCFPGRTSSSCRSRRCRSAPRSRSCA